MKADELEKLFNVKSEDIARWNIDAENGIFPGVPSGEILEAVCVKRDDSDLVSVDASRRFAVYGDPEWGWWIEIASDGAEIPGLWEYLDDEEKVVRSCS